MKIIKLQLKQTNKNKNKTQQPQIEGSWRKLPKLYHNKTASSDWGRKIPRHLENKGHINNREMRMVGAGGGGGGGGGVGGVWPVNLGSSACNVCMSLICPPGPRSQASSCERQEGTLQLLIFRVCFTDVAGEGRYPSPLTMYLSLRTVFVFRRGRAIKTLP